MQLQHTFPSSPSQLLYGFWWIGMTIEKSFGHYCVFLVLTMDPRGYRVCLFPLWLCFEKCCISSMRRIHFDIRKKSFSNSTGNFYLLSASCNTGFLSDTTVYTLLVFLQGKNILLLRVRVRVGIMLNITHHYSYVLSQWGEWFLSTVSVCVLTRNGTWSFAWDSEYASIQFELVHSQPM